jgi:hypothetical protein
MSESSEIIKLRDEVISHISDTLKAQKRLLADIMKDYKTLVSQVKRDTNKKGKADTTSLTASSGELNPILEFLTTNTTSKLELLKKDIHSQSNVLKEKVKGLAKEVKTSTQSKKTNKSRVSIGSPVRKMNNGLTKEFNISSELCKFLNTEENSKKCRAEVTRYIHEYIREKGLKAESGNFRVDENLSKLFDVNANEKVAFFSLGKLLNTHFSYPEQQENVSQDDNGVTSINA